MQRSRKKPRYFLGVAVLIVTALSESSSFAWVQDELAKKEKQLIKQVESDIEKIESAIKRERGEQAQKAFAAAVERLTAASKSPSAGLIAELADDLKKLADFQQQLTKAGISVPSVPVMAVAGAISFRSQVAPLLVSKCGGCHVTASRGDFSMADFEALQKSGMLVPGDPVSSRMIQVIDSGEMPKGNGKKVTEDELNMLREWIKSGAKNDGNDKDRLATLAGKTDNPPDATPVAEVKLQKPTGKETVSFAKDVAPILVGECAGCHLDTDRVRGNLNLATFQALLRGGDNGPIVSPGKGDDSLLVKKLMGTADGNRMPAGRPPLGKEKMALIVKWIDEGAAFDGPSPSTSTKVIAATARAAGLDHQALSGDRLRLAENNWAKALPNVVVNKSANNDVQILSTLTPDRVEHFLEVASDVVKKVKNEMGLDPKSPLVKGKITLYLFEKRYDFNELSVMVEGHPLSKNAKSVWKNDVVDAYLSMLADRELTDEQIQIEMSRGITAVGIAGFPGAPVWFADGMGYSITAKIFQKSDLIKPWQLQASQAASGVKNVDEFLGGKLAQEISALVGFHLVNLLQSDSAKFKKLMTDLKKGIDFGTAFGNIYGEKVEDLIKKIAR